MNFDSLKSETAHYKPAFLLDQTFSRIKRFHVRTTFAIALALILIAAILLPAHTELRAIFLILLSIWLVVWHAEFLFNSYFYRTDRKITYELGAFVLQADPADVTKSFLLSEYGQWILLRMGIAQSHLEVFKTARQHPLVAANVSLAEKPTEKGQLGLADLAKLLIEKDAELIQFFRECGSDPQFFVGSAEWLDRKCVRARTALRWWSRESLQKVPGLAKDWAFGETYHLDKFGTDIIGTQASSLYLLFGHKELSLMETVLAKQNEANVLLVGDKSLGIMEVLYHLARKIDEGNVLPELEHKRIILFDTTAFIGAAKEKSVFEELLVTVLNEAVQAGNIIIVFDQFASFVREGKVLGTDVMVILDRYLASPQVQFIALSDIDPFHHYLESDQNLMRRFEKILITPPDLSLLYSYVEHYAEVLESKHSVFFTFPTVTTLIQSAERYFADVTVVDKVTDLMNEIVPRVLQAKETIITPAHVSGLVEKQTGVPSVNVNTMSAEDRDKLVRLESYLHERIIGQDEAVKAIAEAMRRSRSGLSNDKKPIGSFLFLGPTGVGKTETTKALAELYFGGQDSIIRFDMSEFVGTTSLSRLIGTADSAGILATKLRDKQFGVLLLDEFEKATREVHNLFLQILDEGFFTDAQGHKVSARNLIIVATSNAGSDVIWKIMNEGTPLVQRKPEIIDSIIQQGTFSPELINRFDDTIVFHPLSQSDLEKVTGLMLAKLSKRLEEKGVTLTVTPEAVAYLVHQYADPKFGARSLSRAIQDRIEDVIASKLISGDLQAGSRVDITANDLN